MPPDLPPRDVAIEGIDWHSLRSGVEQKPFDPVEAHSKQASSIAGNIVLLFGMSLAAGFLTIALIIGVADSPAAAKQLLEATSGAFKNLAEFGSAVFAPLLAFVLGYYFNERNQRPPAAQVSSSE